MKRNRAIKELEKRKASLTDFIVTTITEAVGDKTILLRGDSFTDEVNNYITGVNAKGVIFEGDKTYPLSELGYKDALSVFYAVLKP